MSILSIALNRESASTTTFSGRIRETHANRHLAMRIMGFIFIALTVLSVSSITVGRMRSTPIIFELPPEYLPGSPTPIFAKNGVCFSEYTYVSCPILSLGKRLFLYFEQGTHMIVSTSIEIDEYTVGDLIVGWGTPTGITENDDVFKVYWDKRSALLYSRILRPDSRVAYIIYDFDPQQATGWHGFTNQVH